MKTVKITLGTFDRVNALAQQLTRFPYDFDLVSGRYVVDAKSVMGILSLDLNNALDLNIFAPDEKLQEILSALDSFIVKE